MDAATSKAAPRKLGQELATFAADVESKIAGSTSATPPTNQTRMLETPAVVLGLDAPVQRASDESMTGTLQLTWLHGAGPKSLDLTNVGSLLMEAVRLLLGDVDLEAAHDPRRGLLVNADLGCALPGVPCQCSLRHASQA